MDEQTEILWCQFIQINLNRRSGKSKIIFNYLQILNDRFVKKRMCFYYREIPAVTSERLYC